MRLDLPGPPRDVLDRDPWEALELFIDALLSAGASERTIKAYRAAISDFLRFAGVSRLRDVSEAHVNRWKAERLNRRAGRSRGGGRSGVDRRRALRTLHYYTLFLRRFLEWAGHPVKVTVVRAPKPREVEALSEEEVERLEEAAEDLLDLLVLRLLYETGLRASEALGIRVRDVDLARHEIVVREGKYGEPRTVFFSPRLGELISLWVRLRRLGPDDRLIPLSYVGLWKRLKRLARRAGISPSRVRPHVLRHTFATVALRRGMNVMALQRILGHSDVKVTQVYTHLQRDDLRRAYMEAFCGLGAGGPRRCSVCRREVPADALFCPYCGARVRAEPGT